MAAPEDSVRDSIDLRNLDDAFRARCPSGPTTVRDAVDRFCAFAAEAVSGDGVTVVEDVVEAGNIDASTVHRNASSPSRPPVATECVELSRVLHLDDRDGEQLDPIELLCQVTVQTDRAFASWSIAAAAGRPTSVVPERGRDVPDGRLASVDVFHATLLSALAGLEGTTVTVEVDTTGLRAFTVHDDAVIRATWDGDLDDGLLRERCVAVVKQHLPGARVTPRHVIAAFEDLGRRRIVADGRTVVRDRIEVQIEPPIPNVAEHSRLSVVRVLHLRDAEGTTDRIAVGGTLDFPRKVSIPEYHHLAAPCAEGPEVDVEGDGDWAGTTMVLDEVADLVDEIGRRTGAAFPDVVGTWHPDRPSV